MICVSMMTARIRAAKVVHGLRQLRPTPGSLDSHRLEEHPDAMLTSRLHTSRLTDSLLTPGCCQRRYRAGTAVQGWQADLFCRRESGLWILITAMGHPRQISVVIDICEIAAVSTPLWLHSPTAPRGNANGEVVAGLLHRLGSDQAHPAAAFWDAQGPRAQGPGCPRRRSGTQAAAERPARHRDPAPLGLPSGGCATAGAGNRAAAGPGGRAAGARLLRPDPPSQGPAPAAAERPAGRRAAERPGRRSGPAGGLRLEPGQALPLARGQALDGEAMVLADGCLWLASEGRRSPERPPLLLRLEAAFDLPETWQAAEGPGNPFGLAGNKHGWMVEVDPRRPQQPAVIHSWLGRFRHEAVHARAGEPLGVDSGCDRHGGPGYRFVSPGLVRDPLDNANSALLEEGRLEAAQFAADGSGRWIPLEPGTPLQPLTPRPLRPPWPEPGGGAAPQRSQPGRR